MLLVVEAFDGRVAYLGELAVYYARVETVILALAINVGTH